LPSSGLRSQLGEDEVDRLADGAHVLEVFLGHGDVEALLEAHDQLDEVEAVGVEVFLEAGVLDDRVGLDAQDLDRDLAECSEDFVTFHWMVPPVDANSSMGSAPGDGPTGEDRAVQWPMPSPPSTGTIAPVT
jgi:hypothetical protein